MRKKIALIVPHLLLLGVSSINLVGCGPKIEYKNLDIVTFQPFYNTSISTSVEAWSLPDGVDTYNDLVPKTGQRLADKIDSISYKQEDCSQNEVLSGKLFSSKLGPNQIILFEGHGSFEHINIGGDPFMHSVMWTGTQYTRRQDDPDVQEARIIEAGGDQHMEALTLYFIEDYVEDLTGSIVYLGNCFSARECTFAQMFLSKGAVAVIGNSDTTQSAYNDLIEYTTIKKLGEINPDTHLPYTIYEALMFAKGIYGKNDHEKAPSLPGDASEPILFGDPNYRIAKIG